MRRVASIGLLLLLPGCATMMEGTGQSVSVTTTPAGASCEVDRAGVKLGTVNPTPGSLRIDKSKNDLVVTCDKEGYQHAALTSSPKFVGTTFGNIVAGGIIGAVVDASTGANYEYTGEIRIDLAPVGAAPVSSAPPTRPLTATKDGS